MGRPRNIRFVLSMIIIFLLECAGSLDNRAQQKQVPDAKTAKPELIERYTRFIGNEASLIVDLLRKRVSESSNGKGYIILYCGRICRHGEIEAHLSGIVVAFKLKNEVRSNFKVLFGGFRKTTEAEFWFVPEGALFPEPSDTENIADVEFKGKFRSKYVPYECCE